MSKKPDWITFIQWKGTDVCMDVYCPKCGHHNHYDGYFAYYIKCVICDAIFECSPHIELKEITTPDAIKLVQIQEQSEL